jgi:hypothetical protein
VPNHEMVEELDVKESGGGKKFTRQPEILV